MDPTGVEFFSAGEVGWQRLGSKVLIDATAPPTNEPGQRDVFTRIKPPRDGEVKLEDFL
jgi:hypothetical protein